MKFGLLDFNKTVNWYWDNSWNNKALLNIGDAAEYFVIEQLYHEIGIADNDLVRLCINDLTAYRGEKLIVALNIALDSYVGYNNILDNISPDITPVFLGMSFTDDNLTEKQIECLKRYQPIGCRDERSYNLMVSKGVESYLNGCTASCIELDKFDQGKNNEGKILFIDVPYKVTEYIPDDIIQDVVFLNQEMYCRREQLPSDFVPAEWAKSILAEYASKAKMIVTSRFHGAVLALANNIPVIVTLEKYTFRFSWLNNHCQICTEDNYQEIDWRTDSVDFSATKNLINQIAINRIKDTIRKYRHILEITDIQRCNVDNLSSSTNQVLYYYDVAQEISRKWSQAEDITYAFWGANDNADRLYDLIVSKYPNAKLVAVYDMFRNIEYKGICSEHPNAISKHIGEKNFYIIVTAYLAARVAQDICESIDFPSDNFMMCERKFITEL